MTGGGTENEKTTNNADFIPRTPPIVRHRRSATAADGATKGIAVARRRTSVSAMCGTLGRANTTAAADANTGDTLIH